MHSDRIDRLQASGDTSFLRDLEKSKPYVALIRWLHGESGDATADYPNFRYQDGQRHDQHDLAVCVPEEVKSRWYSFRTLEEFASGGQGNTGAFCTVIVDVCHHIETNLRRHGSWPRCYWIVSKDKGAAIRIDTEATVAHWFRQWLKFKDQRWRKHYMCPLFRDRRGPIYDSKDFRDFLRRQGRCPEPLEGVSCFRVEVMRELAAQKRRRRRAILSSLDETPWYKDGKFYQGNPGIGGAKDLPPEIEGPRAQVEREGVLF